MNDITVFSELQRQKLSDGYRIGVPSPDCATDAQIVAKEQCETCGSGLEFVPFTRWDSRLKRHVYYAYAVCVLCDTAHEF